MLQSFTNKTILKAVTDPDVILYGYSFLIHSREDNIKMCLQEIGYECLELDSSGSG
jgi:hypothetical protein